MNTVFYNEVRIPLAGIAETDRTGVPGPKSSLMKPMVTSTHKALSEVVGDILGWEFLEFDADRAAHPWTYDFLSSWVFTAYRVLLELHDEGEAVASLAERVPALPHLDRERWLAVVFRPIGHRLTTSEARRAGAEHG